MKPFSPPAVGTHLVYDQADWIDARVLAAGVAEVHTIPVGPPVARYVKFKATGDFWVKVGAAAAIPAADITDGSGSQLNPDLLFLGNATTIGIISAAIQTVSMMFYS